MDIPDHYKGREQAFVKHSLLRTYLYKLFMIVGQKQSTISYIDCFAGPWKGSSENLSDTSIGISLEIMQNCQGALSRMGKNVHFRALFVEKDSDAYGRLETFLSSQKPGIETKTLHGDFYHVRTKILEWSGTAGFAFFFVDPLGWKNIIEPSTLEPLLKRPNSEYLINFMLDFLRRTHRIHRHEIDMGKVFGEVPETDGLTVEETESLLVDLYRKRLKSIQPEWGGKARSVTVPILYPDKDRTIYHLVYLTHHPLGIVKFMDASDDLQLVQRKVRAQAKQESRIEKSGQPELFAAQEQIPESDGTVNPAVVEAYWLRILPQRPERFGIEELADMLEQTGWFESDLQRAFGELARKGLVKNLDGTPKRRSKFVHFDANRNDGEQLVKVAQ